MFLSSLQPPVGAAFAGLLPFFFYGRLLNSMMHKVRSVITLFAACESDLMFDVRTASLAADLLL
jgi:hypothetical protein